MRRDETITSRQNAWFQRFRRAAEEHESEIFFEGPKQISDAIARGWQPLAIAQSDPDLRFEVAARVPLLTFSPRLLEALSRTEHSQHAIAIFERRESSVDEILDGESVAVALDGIQDPGNAGTIVRLAAAFEASGVIFLEGCADPFSPKTIRATSGTILDVRIARATRAALLAASASRRVPLFAADANGSAHELPAHGAVLILGSEGSGVSGELVSHATRVAIGMSSRVESLNVAAAAAILLHQSYAARTR